MDANAARRYHNRFSACPDDGGADVNHPLLDAAGIEGGQNLHNNGNMPAIDKVLKVLTKDMRCFHHELS
jgi:hypothetical protein